MEKEIKTYLVKVPCHFKGSDIQMLATTKLSGETIEEIEEDLPYASYKIETDNARGELIFDFINAKIIDITNLGESKENDKN